MELPPIPAHLVKYLPGRMNIRNLDPNVMWETDVIDLALGEAVQTAWHQGVQDAKDDHEARQAASGG